MTVAPQTTRAAQVRRRRVCFCFFFICPCAYFLSARVYFLISGFLIPSLHVFLLRSQLEVGKSPNKAYHPAELSSIPLFAIAFTLLSASTKIYRCSAAESPTCHHCSTAHKSSTSSTSTGVLCFPFSLKPSAYYYFLVRFIIVFDMVCLHDFSSNRCRSMTILTSFSSCPSAAKLSLSRYSFPTLSKQIFSHNPKQLLPIRTATMTILVAMPGLLRMSVKEMRPT